MDRKEQEILKILEKDSRTSVQQICKQLSLSRSTVYWVLKKLRNEGTIKRFTIERGDVDERRMIKAYMVMSVEDSSTSGVISEISKIPGLVSSELIFGADDVLVTVRLPDITALDEIRVKLSQTSGVKSVVTYIVQRQNDLQAPDENQVAQR